MTMTLPGWLAPGATEWVDDQLGGRGLSPTGPVEQVKASAWSVVWRIPTAAGTVWFKANGGETRYEVALVAALARWVPGRVTVPIAVDEARGWQLTLDGGVVLRQTPAVADLRTWELLVAAYAGLQRDLAVHLDEMIDLGVPDHRPERLVALTEELIEDPSVGLTERVRLRELLPSYRQWCERLVDSGVPGGLNHDDLHDGNVLVGPDGRWTFFDWGDSAVAFPFTTLLVTLRVVADRFDLDPDDPAVLRVRDAYLEGYGDGHGGGLDLAESRTLAQLATWTGKSARALTWRRALTTASPEELAEHGDSVGGWLEELLSPGPL